MEDIVDSDFDIDETDEVKSDHEDADAKRPRRAQKGVVTKAYKVRHVPRIWSRGRPTVAQSSRAQVALR